MNKKILFILKERHYSPSKNSYGLINSATHVANYLSNEDYDCKVVSVIDGNGIDKEVFEFNPDIVILEAIWCPVYKLKELIEMERYSRIKWIVRVHSDMGFLSCETQALQILNGYIDLHKRNLVLSVNSEKFVKPISDALRHNFVYLPNIIMVEEDCKDKWGRRKEHKKERDYLPEKGHIDIGCFGALRLLKNQCFQALCAIQAADKLDKVLRFHVSVNPNAGSYPGHTLFDKDPIANNLKEMFKNNRHELIIHEWLDQTEFQKLIKEMDLGMQISYTESFNIVSADFINNDRLIVVSDTIDWLSPIMRASTTDYESVVNKLVYMYKYRNSEWLKNLAEEDLKKYNTGAKKEWISFLKKKVDTVFHHGHHRDDHKEDRKDTKRRGKDNSKGKR
jgi:hypothetical protein